MITGNKSLPLVIPLAAATLFLTNLIKNYTTLCFLESVFIEQGQSKPRQEKMHRLEQLLLLQLI